MSVTLHLAQEGFLSQTLVRTELMPLLIQAKVAINVFALREARE